MADLGLYYEFELEDLRQQKLHQLRQLRRQQEYKKYKTTYYTFLIPIESSFSDKDDPIED
jgi:hypothetical protein